jgi:hypothetical protein
VVERNHAPCRRVWIPGVDDLMGPIDRPILVKHHSASENARGARVQGTRDRRPPGWPRNQLRSSCAWEDRSSPRSSVTSDDSQTHSSPLPRARSPG